MLRGPNGFADALGILDVLRWAHAHSVYAGLTFDEVEANRVICHAIQKHGHKNASGTFVQVSEVEGKVEGFIVGVLTRVYHCHVEVGASDLWYITTPRCPARDRVGLMVTFTDWAERHPKCVEVTVAASGAMGAEDRFVKILDKLGYEKFGSLYRKAFAKHAVAA